MEPIRILHMIGSLNIGGSQMMVLNLYKSIDRSRIQFDFIIDHPEERALAEQVELLGAKIYTMPSFTGTNIGSVRKAWNAFFQQHPEYRILHSHVRSYASVYLPIAKRYGLKTVIHSHSTSNGTGIASAVKLLLQYPLRYQADYFFSCSMDAGNWLFGNKVTQSDRHFVLKNAINASLYRYDESFRKKHREALSLNDKVVYAHIGRFHPAKNHSFLLNVFARIHEEQPDSALLLIGDGELREQIESQIAELGLKDAVLLLGNRQDVPEVLQAADCFLFPSLWEGLGIVAVEAQAAGLPCLCSDQVPQEVRVTEDCVFLPLDKADVWKRESVMRSCTPRKDAYAQIVAAGYDIQSTARWLSDFYFRIAESERI